MDEELRKKAKFLKEYYQAIEQGKEVEHRNFLTKEWEPVDEDMHPSLAHDLEYWRIKPNQRSYWAYFQNPDDEYFVDYTAYPNIAKSWADLGRHVVKIVEDVKAGQPAISFSVQT